MLKRHPAWFYGLGTMVLFLVFWFIRLPFLDTLELKYDGVMMLDKALAKEREKRYQKSAQTCAT